MRTIFSFPPCEMFARRVKTAGAYADGVSAAALPRIYRAAADAQNTAFKKVRVGIWFYNPYLRWHLYCIDGELVALRRSLDRKPNYQQHLLELQRATRRRHDSK